MRIHRLTIAAFGPFGASEVIDFDALGVHGLFLLHGPTGSGKTSVLDAVCFALFGQVPGARRAHADRLRSDHAPPHLSPRVCLEFTVAGRRLRIDRRPAHLAPKKRGSGTTKRQAAIVLEEFGVAGWRPLSTRLDEAAEVISEVVGLGLEQFAQVVLLPQGDFAAFLRAKADDRAALLERLFDISRFADVEQWLAEHRRTLRARVDDADSRVRTAVVRAEESLADHAPQIERWRTLPLDELPDQLTQAAAALSEALTTVMAAEEQARAATAVARAAHDRAISRRRLAAELAAAEQEWQHHLDTAEARAAARTTLRRHEAADRTRPLIALADAAAAESERAAIAADEQRERVTALVGPGERRPSQRLAEGDATLGGVRGLLEVRTQDLRRLPPIRAEQQAAAETAESARGVVADLQERLATLTSERSRLADSAAAAPAMQHQVRTLRAYDTNRVRRGQLREAVHAADTMRTQRAHEFAVAERAALDLRHARLNGMAAELALALVEGAPCPVCGSPEHPARATGSVPVTADDVEVAERSAAAAGLILSEATTELAAATTRVEEADAECGRLRSEWSDAGQVEPLSDQNIESLLERAIATLAGIERETARLAALADDVEGIRREQEAAQQHHEAALLAGERAGQTLTDLHRAVLDHDRRLDAAVQAHREVCACAADVTDAAGVLTAHEEFRTLLAVASRAEQHHASALAARDLAADQLQRQLDLESFPERADAQAALLSADEANRVQTELAEADRRAERARGVLDRFGRLEESGEDGPPSTIPTVPTEADVRALADALATAETVQRSAHADYDSVRRAQRSIERLSTDVAAIVHRSAADRRKLPTLDRVADLVAGGGDNMLRMRLSSYVLAARLEQITDLANETLAVMTDGRYRLEHTDQRAKGGSRSGLGLRVLDAWTGTTRDTASLSGGESFMTSLALALGLGQAVLHNTGGRPLQTLLVDEGFGSLDDESLELVMRVLDDLRAGGRTVGIVSHVGELRSRVPAQIEVRKSEQGSSLRVHLGDAPPAA